MSELLRTACNEARKGNSTVKQQVRDIGNKFLNNVEISVQEAEYIVLQLPMRKSSRQVVFINTSPPENRVHLLKPLQEISEIDDDSDKISASGLIKRWYDQCGKPYRKQNRELDIDGLPLETEFDDDNIDDNANGDEDEKQTYLNKNKKRSNARIT